MHAIEICRKLAFTALLASALFGCGGSGDGNGDGDSGFTPALPSNATRITGANADGIVADVFDSIDNLSTATNLKSSTDTPSAEALLVQATGLVKQQAGRAANRVVVRNCDSSSPQGTLTLNIDETPDSSNGDATFSNCHLGGAVISGRIDFELEFDTGSGDFSDHFNGSIAIEFGGETASVVFDLSKSGNDFSGDYTATVNFSISSTAGGGFLVETSDPIVGNSSGDVYDGTLIVTGADSTRLRIDIIALNTADIDIDDGSGVFMDHDTILF